MLNFQLSILARALRLCYYYYNYYHYYYDYYHL